MREKDCASYAKIKEARTEIVFPHLLNIAKRLKPSLALDLGCGAGLWLRMAAEELTGTTFIGCDTDPNMRIAALQNTKGLPNVPCIVNSTRNIANKSMDTICHIAVLMALPTQNAQKRFYKEIVRTLTQTGVMLGVETHPCFRENVYKGFTTDFDDSNYLTSQTRFNVTLQGQEETVNQVKFLDTHWPLMASFNAMIEAGLRPVRLHEFPDISEAQGSPWLLWAAVKATCPEPTVKRYRRELLRCARLKTLA